MVILKSVQKDCAIINKAAGEFLHKLSGNNIKKDITLAAEMSGLKLLRASKVDLSQVASDVILLGAIPDETYKIKGRFIGVHGLMNP